MWDVRACRVCLATRVKLHGLLANKLQQCFQVVTGSACDTLLPHYLCYECSALVLKYYEFQQRCLRGQTALTDLRNAHAKVTEQVIDGVDRSSLKSVYSVHHIPASRWLELQHDPQEVKVKDEPPAPKENENVELLDNPIPLKVEKSDNEYEAFEGYASVAFTSDEDEPLALRKTKIEAILEQQIPGILDPPREKKKKKKGDKKRKKERVKVEDDEMSQDAVKKRRKHKEESPEPRIPKKRGPKPGRTRDNAGLEEFCTIVKLSMEEQLREIEDRRTSSNYLNAPYKCHICYKGFVDTEAFRNHQLKHNPISGEVECVVCKFRFQTKRTLQKHAANHEMKFQCRSCPYISKTATQAKQHQRWHKGITYKCQYCDEVLTKWTSYLSHVRIKHPSEHICNVCGYSFVSQLGLTMHKTMMHKQTQVTESEGADREDSTSTPYCHECDVVFTTRQAWRRHMVTSAKHSTNNDFGNGCRTCGESFSTFEELRIHHRKLHARKRPKNYGKKPSELVWPIKCEHCGEEIASARDYWTHFRRVHPDKKYPIEKSFVCEICGKEFRGNAFLVYHKRTHSEERHYKCKQCPKSFFNRTNLMMHEKTHSDHRPYPCQVCFKAFKLKGALDRHFRSHTGVKPYECEYCGKAFGQSNSRKLHVRTVHLKEPAPYISKSRLERRRQAETVKPQAPFAY